MLKSVRPVIRSTPASRRSSIPPGALANSRKSTAARPDSPAAGTAWSHPHLRNRVGMTALAVVVTLCCQLGGMASAGSLRLGEVARIIDGDTLILVSGETIRLAGINTPELGYQGRPDEPLARQARNALRAQLVSGSVGIEDASQNRDRHGRTLAYLFTSDGTSVQRALLRQGLASTVAISPNDRYLEQFIQAEHTAWRADRGIWGLPYYVPRSADRARGGYQFIYDRVSRIKIGKKWFAFSLGGEFMILIRRADWKAYFAYPPAALDQAAVAVRGWVSKKKTRARLVLNHPFMLERCGTDPQRLCPAD